MLNCKRRNVKREIILIILSKNLHESENCSSQIHSERLRRDNNIQWLFYTREKKSSSIIWLELNNFIRERFSHDWINWLLSSNYSSTRWRVLNEFNTNTNVQLRLYNAYSVFIYITYMRTSTCKTQARRCNATQKCSQWIKLYNLYTSLYIVYHAFPLQGASSWSSGMGIIGIIRFIFHIHINYKILKIINYHFIINIYLFYSNFYISNFLFLIFIFHRLKLIIHYSGLIWFIQDSRGIEHWSIIVEFTLSMILNQNQYYK